MNGIKFFIKKAPVQGLQGSTRKPQDLSSGHKTRNRIWIWGLGPPEDGLWNLFHFFPGYFELEIPCCVRYVEVPPRKLPDFSQPLNGQM
jgi:hypothetical protein